MSSLACFVGIVQKQISDITSYLEDETNVSSMYIADLSEPHEHMGDISRAQNIWLPYILHKMIYLTGKTKAKQWFPNKD